MTTLPELARRNHHITLAAVVAVQKVKRLENRLDFVTGSAREKRMKRNYAKRLEQEDQWAAEMQQLMDGFFEKLDIDAAYNYAMSNWKPVTAAARLVQAIRKAGAPKLEDIKLKEHTVQDVIDGKYKVGVEGSGGNDLQRARAHGLYTIEVNGIGIFARDEKAAEPLVRYLKGGGQYGTRRFARLLGYTTAEIDEYFRMLQSARAVATQTGPMSAPVVAEIQSQLLASAYALDVAQGVQIYLEMALNTSNVSGQAALDHMGINKTFSWAHPRAMASDLFAVRGSKVITNLYDNHLMKLSEIIRDATDPRHPKTLPEVKKVIAKEWPKLSAYQVARIARTETAAVWTATTANTYMANGITRVESIIAHGPSITIETGLPCDMCVDAAAAGPMSVMGDLPPWHPHCRCEIVPVMTEPDGTEWFPPDEPWVGGERPVCGLEGAVALSRRRSRGLRQMRAVLKASGVPGCLIPAGDPGSVYGTDTFYNRQPLKNADEAQDLHKEINDWPDFQGEFDQAAAKAAARKLVDDALTNKRQLKISVDQQGKLTGIAAFSDHNLAALGDTVLIHGIATRGSGARAFMGQFARDAYATKRNISIMWDNISPQLQKSLDNWGFKTYENDAGMGYMQWGDLKTPFKIADELPEPVPALADEFVPAAPVHTPPPTPVSALDESLDDLKAQLYTVNNKIAGHRKKLKKLEAEDPVPHAQVLDFKLKLDADLKLRDELKQKIANYKKQPIVTTTPVEAAPPQAVPDTTQIGLPQPKLPTPQKVGPIKAADLQATVIRAHDEPFLAVEQWDDISEEVIDWSDESGQKFAEMSLDLESMAPEHADTILAFRDNSGTLRAIAAVYHSNTSLTIRGARIALKYDEDVETLMRVTTTAAKMAESQGKPLFVGTELGHVVTDAQKAWKQELINRGGVGSVSSPETMQFGVHDLTKPFGLNGEKLPTPEVPAVAPAHIQPADWDVEFLRKPNAALDVNRVDAIREEIGETWDDAGNEFMDEWFQVAEIQPEGQADAILVMRDKSGEIRGFVQYGETPKGLRIRHYKMKFDEDAEGYYRAITSVAKIADEHGRYLDIVVGNIQPESRAIISSTLTKLGATQEFSTHPFTFTHAKLKAAFKLENEKYPHLPASVAAPAAPKPKFKIEAADQEVDIINGPPGDQWDTVAGDDLLSETDEWTEASRQRAERFINHAVAYKDEYAPRLLTTRDKSGTLRSLAQYQEADDAVIFFGREISLAYDDDLATVMRNLTALAKLAESKGKMLRVNTRVALDIDETVNMKTIDQLNEELSNRGGNMISTGEPDGAAIFEFKGGTLKSAFDLDTVDVPTFKPPIEGIPTPATGVPLPAKYEAVHGVKWGDKFSDVEARVASLMDETADWPNGKSIQSPLEMQTTKIVDGDDAGIIELRNPDGELRGLVFYELTAGNQVFIKRMPMKFHDDVEGHMRGIQAAAQVADSKGGMKLTVNMNVDFPPPTLKHIEKLIGKELDQFGAHKRLYLESNQYEKIFDLSEGKLKQPTSFLTAEQVEEGQKLFQVHYLNPSNNKPIVSIPMNEDDAAAQVEALIGEGIKPTILPEGQPFQVIDDVSVGTGDPVPEEYIRLIHDKDLLRDPKQGEFAKNLLQGNVDTESRFKNEAGEWLEERLPVHKQIVEDHFAGKAPVTTGAPKEVKIFAPDPDGKYVYHVVSNDNLESVRATGLTPHVTQMQNEAKYPAVYFWTDIRDAYSWAKANKSTVIRVERAKLKNVSKDESGSDLDIEGEAIRTTNGIAPGDLEIEMAAGSKYGRALYDMFKADYNKDLGGMDGLINDVYGKFPGLKTDAWVMQRYDETAIKYAQDLARIDKGVKETIFQPKSAERPAAYMTAGGGAAGKSGMRFNYKGKEVDLEFLEQQDDVIFIDPDRIKKMIPEYKQLQDAGEAGAAGMVHEESSILSKMIIARARAEGYSVVIDTTGSSARFLKNIEDFADAGYTVKVSMASVPTNTAIARSMARALKKGGASEGRFVAIHRLKAAHKEASLQLIKWQHMKNLDEWRVYDNSGKEIKLIAEKKGKGQATKVYDQKTFKEIKNKANESSVPTAAQPEGVKVPDSPVPEGAPVGAPTEAGSMPSMVGTTITVEQLKVNLYSVNNKIAGWKKKLKTHPEQADEWQAKLDDLMLEREQLKAQIKASGHKPTAAKPAAKPEPSPKELTPLEQTELSLAVSSWVGSPQTMRIHISGILDPDETAHVPLPGLRAQAQALLDAVENGQLNKKTLYRGGGEGGDPRYPASYSESRAKAAKFGKVKAFKPGTLRGIKVSDHAPDTFDEKQWIMIEEPKPAADIVDDAALRQQSEDRRTIPGGITKERGTTLLNKQMQEGYTGRGASGLKADLMNKLTDDVRADPRWSGSSTSFPAETFTVPAGRLGNPRRTLNEDARTLNGWEQVREAFGYGQRAYGADMDRATMSQLIQNWAHSSSNADWRGVAIQIAAKKEFGTDVRAFAAEYWNDVDNSNAVVREAEEMFARYPDMMDALRSFVRAQYETTQRMLRELGVDEVTLYRGMKIPDEAVRLSPEEGGVAWGAGLSTVTLSDNPLASWSIRHSVARRSHFNRGTTLRCSAPREMIFSCPLTGFGCADEYEVLILNAGDNASWIAQKGDIVVDDARRVVLQKRLADFQDMDYKMRTRYEELKNMNGGAGPDWGTPEKEEMYQVRQNMMSAQSGISQTQHILDNGVERWNYEKESEYRAHIQDALAANPSLAGKPIKVPRKVDLSSMSVAEQQLMEAKKKIGSIKRKITNRKKKLDLAQKQYDDQIKANAALPEGTKSGYVDILDDEGRNVRVYASTYDLERKQRNLVRWQTVIYKLEESELKPLQNRIAELERQVADEKATGVTKAVTLPKMIDLLKERAGV